VYHLARFVWRGRRGGEVYKSAHVTGGHVTSRRGRVDYVMLETRDSNERTRQTDGLQTCVVGDLTNHVNDVISDAANYLPLRRRRHQRAWTVPVGPPMFGHVLQCSVGLS